VTQAPAQESPGRCNEPGSSSPGTTCSSRRARHRLEAIAHRAGLDAHYDEHPQPRPVAAEVALALAELDGSDLAGRRDLVERAADELLAVRGDASGDDVLTYALALAAHGPTA
jgi:hypothetical protein